MPINYVHLKGGEEVTAESLNSRFNGAMGSTSGVNSIQTSDLAPGTFFASSLPSMVGPSGRASDEMTFTKNYYTLFAQPSSISTPFEETMLEFTYPTSEVFRLAVDPYNIHALIVLANVNIDKFVYNGDDPDVAVSSFKDFLQIYLVIEDDAGTAVALAKTKRTLDPRLTLKPISGLNAYNNDIYTHQDVAIRTVVLPEDLNLLAGNIKHVRLVGKVAGMSVTVWYNKGNITVIPIHAKVL